MLTPHHHRLIKLRLRGLTIQQIADRLGVSHKTIKYHFNRIYFELGGIRGFEALPNAYYEYRMRAKLPSHEILEEIMQEGS